MVRVEQPRRTGIETDHKDGDDSGDPDNQPGRGEGLEDVEQRGAALVGDRRRGDRRRVIGGQARQVTDWLGGDRVHALASEKVGRLDKGVVKSVP